MTSRIVENPTTVTHEIDWSKPQLLQYNGIVVATNGNHSSDMFEATVIADYKTTYPILSFYTNWMKSLFTPCKLPLTITFED